MSLTTILVSKINRDGVVVDQKKCFPPKVIEG